ncbi:MAG: hypothetical protein AAGC60_00165 [Acidobacteriota bacterium]
MTRADPTHAPPTLYRDLRRALEAPTPDRPPTQLEILVYQALYLAACCTLHDPPSFGFTQRLQRAAVRSAVCELACLAAQATDRSSLTRPSALVERLELLFLPDVTLCQRAVYAIRELSRSARCGDHLQFARADLLSVVEAWLSALDAAAVRHIEAGRALADGPASDAAARRLADFARLDAGGAS